MMKYKKMSFYFVGSEKNIRFFTLIVFITSILFIMSAQGYCQQKSVNTSANLPDIRLKVQKLTDSLEAPTAMTFPGNGDIWVLEQKGKVRIIRNGKLIQLPLLDLGQKLFKVNNNYDERGLLSIALHPDFKQNRKFCIFYSAASANKSNHQDIIAEYHAPSDGSEIDPNSGRIILTAEKPDGNHNGGCLVFGKDGFLYFSFGDGGGQGDKHGDSGNGQNLTVLLGKILRIDINTDSGYKVPTDNPFVHQANVRPEIWAYGFRNPWRFSFDKVSGQLFAGDVGQDLWEEVDIVHKGANYGWRLMEGTHCYNPATGCDGKGMTMPIAEYNHNEGICVIGGYVYNGKILSSLKSKYIFADWTGPVSYLQQKGVKWIRGKVTFQNIPPNLKITGFGEDLSGELYLLTNPDTGAGNARGGVFKIVKNL